MREYKQAGPELMPTKFDIDCILNNSQTKPVCHIPHIMKGCLAHIWMYRYVLHYVILLCHFFIYHCIFI